MQLEAPLANSGGGGADGVPWAHLRRWHRPAAYLRGRAPLVGALARAFRWPGQAAPVSCPRCLAVLWIAVADSAAPTEAAMLG